VNENEIILVDGISQSNYSEIIEKSLRYAIISLPFTINRMSISSLKQRIENIAKGKIAEEIFFLFARQNELPVNPAPCRTPFFQADRRDFVLFDAEWDIKNNFLVHYDKILPGSYTHLPALIPDKHRHDQWAQRNVHKIEQSCDVAFLFTFMKWKDNRCNTSKGFFDFSLTKEQNDLLVRAWQKYKGKTLNEIPFDKTIFWHEWKRLGRNAPFCNLKIYEFPPLVIAGYAMKKEFPFFEIVRRNQKFLQGVLHTRIKNRGLPIKKLPSFASLFPRFKREIRLGHFRI